METTSQPSTVAVQELLDSMKALYKYKKGTDVIIAAIDDNGLESEFKAHTAVICPRSGDFAELLEDDLRGRCHSADLLEGDIQDESNNAHHKWTYRVRSGAVIANVLQYMYELDYQVDGANEELPSLLMHACVWGAGKTLGINGLKVMAVDKFRLALSHFNIYGAEVGFTFFFFGDFVNDVVVVWDELPSSSRILRCQVSMHIQSNIKEWADKEGAQARFIESSYRLIFRGIQAPTLDLEPVLQVIRAKYQDYLDAETGWTCYSTTLEKDHEALSLGNAETGDAASEKDSKSADADMD